MSIAQPPSAAPSAAPALLRWAGRLVGGWGGGSHLRWLLIGVVWCSVLPVFLSWPEFPVKAEVRLAWERHWSDVVQRKVDHPWYDYTTGFPAGSNEAKRNFRLTVPLLAHLTHTGLPGVHVARFALQAVLIVCLLLAAERACAGRRGPALALALAVAATYTGTSVWRDACLWFDNCAHAFLALALVARGPWLAGGAVLLASFTDERSLLALPLLWVFHHSVGSRRTVLAGLGAALPLYLVLRLALARGLGLATASPHLAVPDILFTNLEAAPLGYWFALEGGWLLVAFAGWRSLRTGQAAAGAWLLLCALLPVTAALGVGDFTRSAAYAFPATLAAAALLHPRASAAPADSGPSRMAAWAAVVSLLVPNVFVMQSIFLETSAPIHALRLWLGVHR